jgi:hypothetical protein
MPSQSKFVWNDKATGTLNFDTLVAGTVTGGPTLDMNRVEPGTLSAQVAVDAETDTITVAAYWQVSNDGTTWLRAQDENNIAETVLATGTSGADAAVTRVLPANPACYGARYARLALVNGVATGAATDTYAVGYNYVRKDFS